MINHNVLTNILANGNGNLKNSSKFTNKHLFRLNDGTDESLKSILNLSKGFIDFLSGVCDVCVHVVWSLMCVCDGRA